MKEITKETFDETVAEGITLVDFWAPWCGPCKQLMPILENLETQMENVTFAKVNGDENQELLVENGVRGIPTVKIFKDGEQVDMFVGVKSADDIKTILAKHS